MSQRSERSCPNRIAEPKALNISCEVVSSISRGAPVVDQGRNVCVVPQIVLDNSPQTTRVRVLDVSPALAAYDLGLVTLKRHLNNPLVRAFWSLVAID